MAAIFLWHVSVVEFKKYLKYLKLILFKALRQIFLQFWSEKAEKVVPGHDIVFHLQVSYYMNYVLFRKLHMLTAGTSLYHSVQPDYGCA